MFACQIAAIICEWWACRVSRGTALTVIDRLLDSDPAIRWQVMRDLTHDRRVTLADIDPASRPSS